MMYNQGMIGMFLVITTLNDKWHVPHRNINNKTKAAC